MQFKIFTIPVMEHTVGGAPSRSPRRDAINRVFTTHKRSIHPLIPSRNPSLEITSKSSNYIEKPQQKQLKQIIYK